MKCVVEFLFVGEQKTRERGESFVELFAIEYTCSRDVVVEHCVEMGGEQVRRIDRVEKAEWVLWRMFTDRFRHLVDGIVELQIPDIDGTSPTAIARVLLGA